AATVTAVTTPLKDVDTPDWPVRASQRRRPPASVVVLCQAVTTASPFGLTARAATGPAWASTRDVAVAAPPSQTRAWGASSGFAVPRVKNVFPFGPHTRAVGVPGYGTGSVSGRPVAASHTRSVASPGCGVHAVKSASPSGLMATRVTLPSWG